MKVLWAPWRMDFILRAREKSASCIFCDLPKEKKSAQNLVLHKGKKAFVILNRYPYSNGHLMVVPRRHLALVQDLNAVEHAELGFLMGRSIKALKKAFNPGGFNIGLNLGRVAGAGIEDHIHYHVVPRWVGDASFMPVVGNARVIPEAVKETYRKLAKVF